MLLDYGSKFEYDKDISEEVSYQMFCNMIYVCQLINNLCFDQEKELRMRLFCEWPKRHKQHTIKNKVWLWLYGLNSTTQNELIKGITSKEEIIKQEQLKYFEISDSEDKYRIIKQYASKFEKYEINEMIYNNLEKDVENIMKIKFIVNEK